MDNQDLKTQFLVRVFEVADGSADRPVETATLGFEFRITFKQTTEIVDALVSEGLLTVHTPTHVRLTRKGAAEIERLNKAAEEEIERLKKAAEEERLKRTAVEERLHRAAEETTQDAPRSPQPAPAPANKPGKPRVVFISHRSEHQELAQAIQEQLGVAFGNPVRVITSRDLYELPGGAQWKKEILKVLKSLSVHLLLCDEKTLQLPWINVEAGVSWLQGKPLIPICFGQLVKRNLPKPYDDTQALDLDDDFANNLLTSLEEHLGSNTKARREPDLFMEAIKDAMNKM